MAKLQASLILEILGRPKDHVSETLGVVVNRLASEKGVKIIKKTLHEPRPLENSDLFTSFAEADIELDSFMAYLNVIFGHMPSNIQITFPEKIPLNNSELNDIGNYLVQRLHQYDALAKTVIAQRDMYAEKLKQFMPEALLNPPAQNKKPPAEKKKKSKKPKADSS